jgi:hypothetical protein
MEIDLNKIWDLIMLGLTIKEHHKVFWTLQIYHHFDDFSKIMIKKNLELENEALIAMSQ